MPYPEMEDVEKLSLTFIRCLKLPQVADKVSKTKVCWYINPDVDKQEKINKANDQNCTYLSVVRPTKKYRQNESKIR